MKTLLSLLAVLAVVLTVLFVSQPKKGFCAGCRAAVCYSHGDCGDSCSCFNSRGVGNGSGVCMGGY